MKFSEMNEKQKRAFVNIKHAANYHIGGLENGVADEIEGSCEQQCYKNMLADHKSLVEQIYKMAITELYREGEVWMSSSLVKDIKFCGKEWLMEQVEKRVTKLGY